MNRISVSGTGTAIGPPDQAFVSIGVEVMARSVAEAKAKAADDATNVLAALRHHGLEDEDLVTSALSVHPEYDHRDGRRLRGYRVANVVNARVRTVDAVGAIVDAAVEAGGDSTVVHGVNFAHEDSTQLEVEARDAAWADAKRKASQLSSLSGTTLGPVLSIVEQSHGVPMAPVRSMAQESAMATPIESGALAVAVTITVEFSIEPVA